MQLLLLWLFVAALRSNVDYNPFNFSVCPAEALDMKSCIKGCLLELILSGRQSSCSTREEINICHA